MPDIRVGIGGRIQASFTNAIDDARGLIRDFGSAVNEVAERATGMNVFEIVLDNIKDKLVEVTVGPLASFVVGIGAVDAALWLMDKTTAAAAKGLEEFSTMENLEGAFRTLLGGAAQAKQRLAELADFAAKTPFNLPEVASASRTLEVLTHGALSTGEGLRLVGDVSAQTGTSLQEISMWIGRLYDNLQSGRPIGEAMARLQELGTVSGTTRAQIEAMQKAGVAGNEVWKVAKAELDQAKGSMEVLSKSLSGLQSTLQDTKAALMREIGKSFVDQQKTAIQGSTDLLEKLTPVAEHAAEVLADLNIGDMPDEWFSVFDSQIKSVITSVLGAKDAIKYLIDGAAVLGIGLAAAVGSSALGAFAGLMIYIRNAGGVMQGLITGVSAYTVELRASIAAIIAATRAEAERLVLQGRSTVAAYAQATATVGLSTALKSAAASAWELTAALLVNPVTWVAAAAAAAYLWSQRLDRAVQAQAEFAKETLRLTNGVQTAAEGIITVTDKINRLTEAYKDLKSAREALANAPKDSDEAESAENRIKAAQGKIHRLEGVDDRDLKPSDDRQKYVDELKKAQMEAYEKALDPVKALELAQARLNDQLSIQHGLEAASAKAAHAASAERLAAIDAEIEAKRRAHEEVTNQLDEYDQKISSTVSATMAPTATGAPSDPALSNAKQEKEKAMARLKSLHDEIEALTATRQSAVGSSESARTSAADGRLKVQTAQDAVSDATKKKADLDAKLAELTAEQQIAALEGEGIGRAYREYEIRQALVQQQWAAAKATNDTVKAEEAKLHYMQNQLKITHDLEAERKANQDRDKATADAQTNRVENDRKRARDLALATGKMTPEEHRQSELAALDRQRTRANQDAAQMEADARGERSRGNEADADKLDKSAIDRRRDADNAAYDFAELSRKPSGGKPVADSLARLGLGGNVSALGGDKSREVASKLDRQTQVLNGVHETLKLILQAEGVKSAGGPLRFAP